MAGFAGSRPLVWEEIENEQTVHKVLAKLLYTRRMLRYVPRFHGNFLYFGKYFHLPVSVNFGKWILFTGKSKKLINTMKKLKIQFINALLMQNKVETSIECF
jgi:hypothetical protein